jgi:tRNA (guanine-N7-)-methyltransferase
MRKNKLDKFKENENFDHVVQPDASFIMTNDYELKGKWGKEFFKNDNPIVLELGCGRGEYTVELAKMFPDKNFLGVDIKGSRIYSGAKAVHEEGMKNAGFVRMKIDFITSVFENEIDEVWITFPDPFPEKPNRRLTSPVFLNRYLKIIKPNALINLKTDNMNNFTFTKEIAEKNGLEIVRATDDLYGKDEVEVCGILNIKTTYEKRFLKAGDTIKLISFHLDREIAMLPRKKKA